MTDAVAFALTLGHLVAIAVMALGLGLGVPVIAGIAIGAELVIGSFFIADLKKQL